VRISKRLIKRIAISFGLVVGLLMIVNGVLAWSAQNRFDRRIAELREAKQPASLAELAPTPIAPEKNAAVYLQQIEPQLDSFHKDYIAFYETPLGKQVPLTDGLEMPVTGEQLAAMRSIVDAYPTIQPAMQKAAACDQYASLFDFSLPASEFLESSIKAPILRNLTHYASLKIAVLSDEGRSSEAVRLALQMLRITRLRDQEPALMSHEVSLSVRAIMLTLINLALRHNEVAPEVRTELDAELAADDNFGSLQAALRGERAFSISYIMEQTSPLFLKWPVLNWMTGELDAEDQACKIAELPLDQIRPRQDPITKQTAPPQFADVKSQLIGASLRAAFKTEFRRLALTRCLRVVNALGKYRAQTGNEAQNIEQLLLPREATVDPFSGNPLHLKRIAAGWVVYSVWENGVDDGGRFDFYDGDWGFGPPGYNDEAK
jgi:hypothetical protein